MHSPVLKYYDISPNVTAFSTTRHGGHSRGAYGDFNINLYCGDNENNIAENRRELCSLLGIKPRCLIVPHQIHGTEICHIDEGYFDKGMHLDVTDGVDAVMTDMRNVCIGISTADCIPVVIYDQEHHAACAVHAGWRGTVGFIVYKAVEAMRERYDSRPIAMRAVIGPGISIDNFEVGDEVYDRFMLAGFDMSRISRRYPVKNNDEELYSEKWHIDLWECNRLQLVDAGVNDENIQVAGICTYSCKDDFFSARRLGIDSGRIYTGIVLR